MLHLVDNGLITRGSHSYNIAAEIRGACAKLGIEIDIYACNAADSQVIYETGAIPIFDHSLYDQFTSDNSSVEMRTAEVLNQTFLNNLLSIEKRIIHVDDVILFPAITQNQILGLADFIGRQSCRNCPSILCQLMFPVNWTSSSDKSLYSAPMYKLAFERLKLLPHFSRLKFVAETSSVAAEFNAQFGLQVYELPIPLGFNQNSQAKNITSRPLRFGFLGYSKTEKGFHLIANAIKGAMLTKGQAEYFVQINHTGWETEVLRTQNDLLNIDGVTIFEGALASEEYNRLISLLDVLMVPYDPDKYRERGSGILAEAIALGLPVITTEGTWAARSIKQGLASGIIMGNFSSQALADSIQKLANEPHIFMQRAAEIKAERAPTFSFANYIARVEEISGVTSLRRASPYINDSSKVSMFAGGVLKFDRGSYLEDSKDHLGHAHVDQSGLWVGLEGLRISVHKGNDRYDLSLNLSLFVSESEALWREVMFCIAGIQHVSRFVQGGGFRQVQLFIPRDFFGSQPFIDIKIDGAELYKFSDKEKFFSFCISSLACSHVPRLSDLAEWNGNTLPISPGHYEDRILFEEGWSSAEDGWIWSIAPTSKLSFVVEDGVFNGILRFDCWTPEVGAHSIQKIRLYVNGQLADRIDVSHRKTFSFHVSRNIVPLSKYISLRFEAESAFDLSEFGDNRVLYFAIASLGLS